MKQGWSGIYPFKGLIPLNPWLPNLTGYNYSNADIPTCICSGTIDGSYNNSEAIYDNLISASKLAYFNSLNGIGHVSSFINRDTEMMECMNWIDSLANPNLDILEHSNENSLILQSNIVKNTLIINSTIIKENVNVQLIAIDGKMIENFVLKNGVNQLDLSKLFPGIYFVKYGIDGKVKAQKIIIEN